MNDIQTKPIPEFSPATPLFIVFNAGSGSGDKRRNQEAMAGVLKDGGRVHEFFVVTSPEQIEDMADRAVQAAVAAGGAVIVAGGDGTINAVAARTLPTGRPFGIVPQGTFNYSSRAHSIPLETVPATRALLAARIKPVQAGLVNGRLFLVNASLGLYPQLLQDREAYKKQYGRNRSVAFWAGIVSLLTYRRQFSLVIEHDGQREVVHTPTLFVGNNALQLDQVGLPEVQAVQSRQLAAVVLRPMRGIAMLGLALRGALGALGDAQNVRDFAFATMSVEPLGARSPRHLKVATDGEICWLQTPLQFSVARESLMLLVPSDAA